jgi:hypothetical protein
MADPLPAREALPQLADRLPLGAAGLAVSPFCLGVIRDRHMVPLAFDAGINFFFVSADLHWPLYEEMRQGLARLLARGPHVRDEIVVAGVSYITQPVFAGTNFNELLSAVPRLGRLDLLVAGGAYANEFAGRRERYLTSPYTRGLGARAFGASFHERSTALNAINHRQVDLAYVRYNPAHPGARHDLFPGLLPEPRPLLYNFRSVLPPVRPERWRELGLDEDHWIPEPGDFYRFVLSRPEMNGILGSVNTPGELEALDAALTQGPLEAEEEEYLVNLAALAEGRARLAAGAP